MYGTVMKITDKQMVVLCEDGKFRNLPLTSPIPALGERIPIPDKVVAVRPLKRSFPISRLLAAAIFLVLFIGASLFVSRLYTSAQPVAMVAVDINPSVELLVDKEGRVRQASLVNDDARLLLAGTELTNREFYDALNIIINKAIDQGYLDLNTDRNLIMISVVDLNKSLFKVDPARLSAPAKSYDIEVFYVAKEQEIKARQAGLTVNKYLVYEKAQKAGIALDKETLRKKSVVRSLQQAGIDPKSFFRYVRALDKNGLKHYRGGKKNDDNEHDERDQEEKEDDKKGEGERINIPAGQIAKQAQNPDIKIRHDDEQVKNDEQKEEKGPKNNQEKQKARIEDREEKKKKMDENEEEFNKDKQEPDDKKYRGGDEKDGDNKKDDNMFNDDRKENSSDSNGDRE
ncbi:anti-sigma-I factor RsgI family protein [Thermincola ferriacetica]